MFRLDIFVVISTINACSKPYVAWDKLKEKDQDAFSDGGNRYMHESDSNQRGYA